MVARVLLGQTVAQHVKELRLQPLSHRPELLVGNRVDPVPAVGFGEPLLPAIAQVAIEQVVPVRRQEGGYVHAVGHVLHRVVGGIDLRPQVRADARGDPAVDCRDAVLESRAADRERGHVEVGAAGRAPEFEQLARVDAQLRRPVVEVAAKHLFVEVVVARRHRCVRGEHRVQGRRLERTGEVEARSHQHAHALEHQEGCVSLVDVPDGG